MTTKRIITLGNAASGKSNYMSASMLYITRHWNKKYLFTCNNNAAINTINLTENTLKAGQWMAKTQEHNELEYSIKHSSLIPFVTTQKKLIIDDWMGEAFDALENLDDWENTYHLDPALKNPFLQALAQASCYVIFIDAQKLLNGMEFDNVLNSFRGLQTLITEQNNFRTKEFAFIITKSDVLLDTEFMKEGSSHLDLSKIQDKLRNKYQVFTDFLRYHGIKYKIFAVTCVPIPEHSKIDTEYGTMPNKEWSVQDMESVIIDTRDYGWKIVQPFCAKAIRQLYDQVAPFRWLFGEFFFNRIY